MKKRKNVKALHNFHIAFGIMIKIYPEKFIMELLLTIFNNIISFFSFTYILRFVVNGLQTERPVSQLIAYVMIMMVLQVLISSVSIVCNNYFAPIFNKRSESRMNAIINKKSLESDIANYEDPQMYALYGRALSGGVGSIEKVGTTITSITGMVINLALSSFLIVAIDPVLFVFALMPLLINITNKYVSRKRYEYGVISSEIMRKNGYTQRVFYQSEYAKEMRLTNIHRVIVGKGFDVSDLNRGNISPHEIIHMDLPIRMGGQDEWWKFMHYSFSSDIEYQYSKRLRMQKICSMNLPVSGLIFNERYRPLPYDILEKMLRYISIIYENIDYKRFCVSCSVMYGRIFFWDIQTFSGKNKLYFKC